MSKKAETKKVEKKETVKELDIQAEIKKAVEAELKSEKEKLAKQSKELESKLKDIEEQEALSPIVRPDETSIRTGDFQRRIAKQSEVDVIIPRAYSSFLGRVYEFSLNGVNFRLVVDGVTKNKLPKEVADYWNNSKLPRILDHDFADDSVDTILS